MTSYFTNPELKRSSIVLFVSMLIFLLITTFTLNTYYRHLKEDYINAFGGMIAKISETDPNLAKEVVPILTKEVSKEEARRGSQILKEYGLDANLNHSLFPYLNETVRNNNNWMIVIFVGITILLFILNFYNHFYFYKRIRRITLGAKNVIEGDYNITIEEDQEGDFSKLATAFNSMAVIIRNHFNELKKEKQFLVDLLSDISHQLKTPLSSLIVYNEIMLEKEITYEQQKQFLISNQNQLNRMEWLIKSILKLARLDVKAIQFVKQRTDMNETVQDSIKTIEGKAIEKGVNLLFQQEDKMILDHDPLWMKEALINIIKNCIEHSEKGNSVIVTTSENPIYKRIIIEDNGEGISDDDLPNIFKRFYKAKNSQKNDSVGIGLALAKAIIEGQDGVIEAESIKGVGTKFIITFLKY